MDLKTPWIFNAFLKFLIHKTKVKKKEEEEEEEKWAIKETDNSWIFILVSLWKDVQPHLYLKKCKLKLIQIPYLTCTDDISLILTSIREAIGDRWFSHLLALGEQTGISLLEVKLKTFNKTIEPLPFGKVILLPVVYPEDASPKVWNAHAKFIDCIVYSFKYQKQRKWSYKIMQLVKVYEYC